MNRFCILLFLPAILCWCSCLERTTRPEDTATEAAGSWRLAGTFGGQAEVSLQSDDPLEIRYRSGGFKLISGLDVTDDEVWVCDLDISRIQVFDYDGNVVDLIGSGVDASLALPDDFEHYDESTGFNRREDTRWEDVHGAIWFDSYKTHFRAADIVLAYDGYWLADQTRTCGLRDPRRKPQVFFVPFAGDVRQLGTDLLVWPSHLAASGDSVAAGDYRANILALCRLNLDPLDINYLQRGGSFPKMMALDVTFADNPQYLAQHYRFSSGSSAPGEFYMPGGMAFAFDKFAVCDTLNRRIQLFEAREGIANWAKFIRSIGPTEEDGTTRFVTPLDIEITTDGTVFVIDSNQHEIVLMDHMFHRIGSMGYEDLVEPYALALSPDGRHCFVTDRSNNTVLHYARSE